MRQLFNTAEPSKCTNCGRLRAFTEDWTLWPWPDGAALCSVCNNERHEREEWDRVGDVQPSGGCEA